jgi:hypothetical protein
MWGSIQCLQLLCHQAARTELQCCCMHMQRSRVHTTARSLIRPNNTLNISTSCTAAATYLQGRAWHAAPSAWIHQAIALLTSAAPQQQLTQ